MIIQISGGSIEREEDVCRRGGEVILGMNNVGEMDGGSPSLGSKSMVDAVEGILMLVDIIATETQLAKEMKRKAASNEMFMSLSSVSALADDMGKGGIFSLSKRKLILDEQLNIGDEIYAENNGLGEEN